MIKNKPLISIIIPVKKINDYIYENVEHSLKMEYKNFEIIILPDNASNVKFKKTKIIPSGNVKPGEKRNLGVKHAKGEIIAFIDDDAYPRKDWLTNAIKGFKDKSIAAIGGPGVTPPKDSLSQKISGAIYEYGSLNYNYRYTSGKKQEIDDFPSCNLLIRKPIGSSSMKLIFFAFLFLASNKPLPNPGPMSINSLLLKSKLKYFVTLTKASFSE